MSDGADLVVLPELVTSGSGFADAAEATRRAEPVTGPTVTALRELSARHGIVLVAGFNETSGLDRPYNSAVVIDRGELLDLLPQDPPLGPGEAAVHPGRPSRRRWWRPASGGSGWWSATTSSSRR